MASITLTDEQLTSMLLGLNQFAKMGASEEDLRFRDAYGQAYQDRRYQGPSMDDDRVAAWLQATHETFGEDKPKEGLFPTLAYIITSKRKSGPSLTKSYGVFDEFVFDEFSGPDPDLPKDSHLCLYESPEQAEKAFAKLEDPEFWEILPVIVCDESYTE